MITRDKFNLMQEYMNHEELLVALTHQYHWYLVPIHSYKRYRYYYFRENRKHFFRVRWDTMTNGLWLQPCGESEGMGYEYNHPLRYSHGHD